ncbi:MAG: sensor histidine kinase [Bacteroidia bacterium]
MIHYIPKIFFHRFTYHVLFWLFFLLLFFTSSFSGVNRQIGWHEVSLLLFLWIGLMIPVYTNLFILIPRILYQGQFLLYTLSTLTVISSASSLIHFLLPLLFQQPYNNYFQSFAFVGFFVIMTSGLKLYRDGIQQQLDVHESQTKQLQAELNLLKSQINPHFLFNTLNNLYALTLEKSDNAPEVVLKLSEIMRYLLESSKKELTELSSECKFLANYIELEKLRLNKNAKIDFQIQGNIQNIKIPPVLFIPFIENCFKHGDTTNLIANIFLKVEPNELYFYVENNKPLLKNKKEKYSGIGINNIKRRLELLLMDNYTLDILDNENKFEVKLYLKLKR